jgi:hypothetical protein
MNIKQAQMKIKEVLDYLEGESGHHEIIAKLCVIHDELEREINPPKMSPLGQMLFDQAKALNKAYMAGMKTADNFKKGG